MAPPIITDAEIARLVQEAKQLPPDYMRKFALKPKRGHQESELSISGGDGHEFAVIIRKSQINHLDFSVILAYTPAGSNKRFLLRRYNGKSHDHSNAIEGGGPFYDFHVHEATERYQRRNGKEDGYAVVTNRYADCQAALDCLLSDCGFVPPSGENPLFSAT
jgi:hypothetical protein